MQAKEKEEDFLVSARKYRPLTFAEVVGQKTIITTLKNAIKNNQLAQAFLFCGPRGVGKTTCARILAKTINCTNLTENYEACGVCPSCKAFNEIASFNLHELDAASNNSVDDIRNLVDQVRIPPQAGKYKVYIIDEVHMLSASAFNAFLKTLEEPPGYAKFILATTEKHKIIPTILSRCQIFDFRRITTDDITGYLAHVAQKENIQAERDALQLIAQKADGALRDALSIFDQLASSTEGNITYKAVIENLNILDYEFYFDTTYLVSRGDITGTLLMIDKIIDNGFDGLLFLNGFASHLRNLLVCKDPQTLRLLDTSDSIKEKYKEQGASVSVDFILKALDIISQCDINYKTSSNKRLHLELAFLNLCTLNKTLLQKEAPAEKKNTELNEEIPEAGEAVASQKAMQMPREKAVLSSSEIISIRKFEEEKNHKNMVAEAEQHYGEEAFTEQQLQEAWLKYAEKFKQSQPNLYITLTTGKPSLTEENLFEFPVTNKVQQDDINDRKTEILSFLKKELKNKNLNFEVTVTELLTQAKPFTPEEKLKKMAEKNPEILNLKNQLNLDINF